jgi:hypothetical protein
MLEHELSMDELVAQEAIELPSREMMQTLTITTGNNTAAVFAVNAAIAANILSPGATATATGGAQAVGVLQNSGAIIPTP